MNRIDRLSVNQSATECFTCPICTGTTAASPNDDMCDFCWYDFEATERERRMVNESRIFRELSIDQWYAKLHVPKIEFSLLSPVSIMNILHDCFRLSSNKPTIEHCLEIATNVFPESVPWLRRLIRGIQPVLFQPTSVELIYKFAAGIGRTPIWYKVTKDESNSGPKWSWTPYNPTEDFANTAWLPCPQLLVAVGFYAGKVPHANNIFIIMFLHTFRPDPPAENPDVKRNQHQRIKNEILDDAMKTLQGFTFRTSTT